MNDNDHRELAEVLTKLKGKAALTRHRCELLDKLDKDWNSIESPSKQCLSVKQPRTEILWTNYDVPGDISEWQNPSKSSMPLFDALMQT